MITILRNLRFSEDKLESDKLINPTLTPSSISKKLMTLNGMPISKELLPDLYNVMTHCCEKFGIGINNIQGYVYPSSEIQAQCVQFVLSEYVLAISSGMVNLLNNNELKFVVGHEIGHALLNHNNLKFDDNNDHEKYRLSRAGEISADRLGFICCDEDNYAFSALMKICSGLDDDYLNYDINSFINLAKNLKEPTNVNYFELTHPPMVIRARAILWLSMSNLSNNYQNESEKNNKDKAELDRRVNRDLTKYIDNQIFTDLNVLVNDFKFWLFTITFVSDGLLSESEQLILKSNFSEELVLKLKVYLSGLSKNEVTQDIWIKLNKSYVNLKNVSKSIATKELNGTIKLLEKHSDSNSLNDLKMRIQINDR